MILREQWTVDLSKSNRGEDFRKEVFVRRTEQQVPEDLDEYIKSDNGVLARPIAGKDCSQILYKDLDPNPGSVVLDFSRGEVASKDPACETNQSVEKPDEVWKITYDPQVHQPLSIQVQSENSVSTFDFKEGKLMSAELYWQTSLYRNCKQHLLRTGDENTWNYRFWMDDIHLSL